MDRSKWTLSPAKRQRSSGDAIRAFDKVGVAKPASSHRLPADNQNSSAGMPMPRANLLRARARQRCRTSPGHRAWPWGWSRPRSRSRCGSRYRCRSWCAALDGRLDGNRHRRSCFEEVDRGICSLWRLIGIEPEVIQCAPANRVGILVLCKRFAVPCKRVGRLGRRPRRAYVTAVAYRPIVREARMLRRRVKSDVTDVNSSS